MEQHVENKNEVEIAISLITTIINSATKLDSMLSDSLKLAVDHHNKNTSDTEFKTPHLESNKDLQKALGELFNNASLKHIVVAGIKYSGIDKIEI